MHAHHVRATRTTTRRKLNLTTHPQRGLRSSEHLRPITKQKTALNSIDGVTSSRNPQCLQTASDSIFRGVAHRACNLQSLQPIDGFHPRGILMAGLPCRILSFVESHLRPDTCKPSHKTRDFMPVESYWLAYHVGFYPSWNRTSGLTLANPKIK